MCRHPRLRLRKPQVTSAARVKGFTKIKVAKFVDIFEPVLGNFSSHRLFTYEDKGLIVVQHKLCKVISLKGKRSISLSSAERGSLVTIVTCMNTTVTYVPLLLVFPRSNVNTELLDSTPPGSIAACHKAEWMQKDSFTYRFKHFVRFVKPSKKDLDILTRDGHSSHSRNVEVIDCARENLVQIYVFPRTPLINCNLWDFPSYSL